MDELLRMSKKECVEAGKADALRLIDEGMESVLDSYLLAHAKIEYYKAMLDELHEEALSDFEKYGEKSIQNKGRKVEKRETGSRYDYSRCNYPGYRELKSDFTLADLKKKAMEKEMRLITKDTVLVIEETGEEVEVRPPVKTSTTKLTLTY